MGEEHLSVSEEDEKSWSLMRYFYVYSGTLALLTVLCAVLSCLNLSLPYILKLIIDDILPQKQLTYLAYALCAVLVVLTLKNLTYYQTKIRITWLGEQIALDVREQLFQHLHQLSIGYFENNKPGKLSSRLMQDVNCLKSFIKDQMMKFMMNVLIVLVSFSIMFWLHMRLAVVALMVLPLHWLVHRIYQRSIKKHARKAQNAMGSVTGDVVEQFSGVQEVKSSRAEKEEEKKFKSAMRKGMSAKIEEKKQYLRQKIFADGLVGFGQLLVIGFAAYAIINGTMKVGTFIAFYGYTGMLYPKTLKLISQAGKFSSVTASVDRISEIMNKEPEVQVWSTALPRDIQEGKVEFRDVSFSFEHEQVLSNFSFTVHPGERVLVTGVSGSGKSTLLNLIPRFYDLDSGQIRIDNIDVREYTLGALREQIGIVFQDGFLFNSSVRENIQYAKPDATYKEIIKACQLAKAHHFITELPDGYRTVIGEEGVHLSGGEEQRLILARTILKEPKILILDEALTTLDRDSRREVAGNLLSLMENRTVFAVTHDPSVFGEFDHEICLKKNQKPEVSKVAVGSH